MCFLIIFYHVFNDSWSLEGWAPLEPLGAPRPWMMVSPASAWAWSQMTDPTQNGHVPPSCQAALRKTTAAPGWSVSTFKRDFQTFYLTKELLCHLTQDHKKNLSWGTDVISNIEHFISNNNRWKILLAKSWCMLCLDFYDQIGASNDGSFHHADTMAPVQILVCLYLTFWQVFWCCQFSFRTNPR